MPPYNQSIAAENFPFCTIEPNEARCAVPGKGALVQLYLSRTHLMKRQVSSSFLVPSPRLVGLSLVCLTLSITLNSQLEYSVAILWFPGGGRALRLFVQHVVGGRCKLDPGLKAPPGIKV